MPKITFIGAGSTVFAKNLIGDILSYPELAESTLTLYDIDAERLRTSEIVARKLAQAFDAHPPSKSRRIAASRSKAPTMRSPCSRSAAIAPRR